MMPPRILRQMMRDKMIARWVRYDKDKPDLPIKKIVHRRKFPFDDMELGSHFFVHREHRNARQLANLVTSSVAYARKKTGREFYMENYPTGIRVWRIG